MKCIVTRGSDGLIDFWPVSANKLLKKWAGTWGTNSCKELIVTVGKCLQVKGVCKLLGFIPRKGSKQIVDIKVTKCKS